MNFIDRLKQTVSRGYENASGFLNDAAEKAKELGEKGILEFEIKKLEKEIEHLLPVLGSEVYSLYRSKKLKKMNEAEEVQRILDKIETIENQISKKEDELEVLNEK